METSETKRLPIDAARDALDAFRRFRLNATEAMAAFSADWLIEFWDEHCEAAESNAIKAAFGNVVSPKLRAAVIKLLKANPDGLTKTAIINRLQPRPVSQLTTVLWQLVREDRVIATRLAGRTRPATLYRWQF